MLRFQRGWKRGRGLSLAILLLSAQGALASPGMRDRGGELVVQVGLSAQDQSALEKGTLKVGQPIQVAVSFVAPQLGNFQPQGQARIELRPLDSQFQFSQNQAVKALPAESSSHLNGVSFEVPLANAKPLSRVEIPLRWIPGGKMGSGFFVQVTVETPLLRTYGQASFHLASTAQGLLTGESTPWKIFQIEQSRFSAMKGADRGSALTSETSLPFHPQQFSESLKKDSMEVQDEEVSK